MREYISIATVPVVHPNIAEEDAASFRDLVLIVLDDVAMGRC